LHHAARLAVVALQHGALRRRDIDPAAIDRKASVLADVCVGLAGRVHHHSI